MFKHLGVNLTNDRNISDHDVSVKRAQFIAKSVEIEQEFWYASGNTKLRLNQIYNSHFTGSPLWDLSSSKVLSLESGYNLSIKNMFQLPIATDRNLIVPIAQQHHLRTILMLRLWGFLKQVRNSKKMFPKMMLNLIISDVRSKTGGNLRKILLNTDKSNVSEITRKDVENIQYHPLSDNMMWKGRLISELIGKREGQVMINEFSDEEATSMIDFLCVS